MDLASAGLREQPFRTHGKPVSIVSYASQEAALRDIRKACAYPTGLALLQGPPLSGKSTLLLQLVESRENDCAFAIIDGEGLNTTGLLEAVLRQYGYEVDFSSANELLAMLRVFALQQAASHDPPLLIIENAHALNPSALRALCELADLRVRQTSALKIVLASDRSLDSIVRSPAMACIARRIRADVHLRPMNGEEAVQYLHEKLRAAGSQVPEYIIPDAVCEELREASGGWPGILDRIALLAIARAASLPVTAATIERPVLPLGTWDDLALAELEQATGDLPLAPKLFVTRDGATIGELNMERARLLIGRSEHNDLAIHSRFISRHHLMLVRHGGSTFMMDLNSTNGTYVNSKRVSNHVLVHDDVIALGHHRIKYCDPHATVRGALSGADFADTSIMKTLEDMRKLLAQENTEVLPAQTENLPTAGNS